MNRPIITLTSDWNNKSYYEAAVKGTLLSTCGDVNIVNISNNIAAFNISQAVFVLKNSYKFYPKNSIHIIAVNSNHSNTQKYLLAKYENHIFIGTDNGFFSLFFDDEDPEILISIDVEENANEAIFPELKLFPKVISKILNNSPLEEIGQISSDMVKASQLRPVVDNSSITGHVVYVDSFENAITNISKERFEKIGKGRKFEILVQNNNYKIEKITTKYSETKEGDLLAIFNSVDLLEIAIKDGSVFGLLSQKVNSIIRIKFFD